MRYAIILEDKALREAREAYNFYEKRQEGLGDKFKKELDKSITRIQENPKLHRKIKQEIRQTLLYKFPYVIVYAVFHTNRNPQKKFRTTE